MCCFLAARYWLVDMDVGELFSKGLLKTSLPSRERARKSIEIAGEYLEEAQKALKAGACRSSILAAYNCMFHSARAVLFCDGVAERSHFAVYEYLREKHRELGNESINMSNIYRDLRHRVAYGLDTSVGSEEAKAAISFADGFLNKVKKYLEL